MGTVLPKECDLIIRIILQAILNLRPASYLHIL